MGFRFSFIHFIGSQKNIKHSVAGSKTQSTIRMTFTHMSDNQGKIQPFLNTKQCTLINFITYSTVQIHETQVLLKALDISFHIRHRHQ